MRDNLYSNKFKSYSSKNKIYCLLLFLKRANVVFGGAALFTFFIPHAILYTNTFSLRNPARINRKSQTNIHGEYMCVDVKNNQQIHM